MTRTRKMFYGSPQIPQSSTLVEVLRHRFLKTPDRYVYTFLVDGEIEQARLSYSDLDLKARAIATLLHSLNAYRRCVLLLHPPGPEFVEAFLGCLYAGAIAVPAYPPKPNRSLARLQTILADCKAPIVLSTDTILEKLESMIGEARDLNSLLRVASNRISVEIASDWRMPPLSSDSLAFLQYTSGSTSAPKGVMVSHNNILHNEELIKRAFGQTEDSVIVGWLPFYHDMGLIGNLLQPLYTGSQSILMDPLSFLQKPLRWLQAISFYKATTSGGPNFAYDLCVRKIDIERREEIDLSTWSVAFNGAEPIRAETVENFSAVFSAWGFQREAFYPCYGLAESTLLVSARGSQRSPTIKSFRAKSLEVNRAEEISTEDEPGTALVSCGGADPELRIEIINPSSLSRCAPGEVGEIWVAGPSVAQGYWNCSEKTQDTFCARPAGSSDGQFLRTGDLGFLHDGELFVTGRIKDLLIIRGLNHYPQDIESTVERSHPALRRNAGAAFSIDVKGEERLVIIQEVERHRDHELETAIETIRQTVAEEHEIQPYAVVLVRPGSIPKTSSNKIQRRACRAQFLSRALNVMLEWRELSSSDADALNSHLIGPLASKEAVQNMLVAELSTATGIPSQQFDINQPISTYGLDSLAAINLIHRVELKAEASLPIAVIMDDVSIAQIATLILEQSSIGGRSTERSPVTDFGISQNRVSRGQQALWFLHQVAPESSAYNLSFAAWIQWPVDIRLLEEAFQLILDRHPSLRVTFSFLNGEIVQNVQSRAKVCFAKRDASAWSDDFLREQIEKESSQPFDLKHGPVFRVTIFSKGTHRHALLIAIHHIVADFWSFALLMKEFSIFYHTLKVGEPTVQLPPPSPYSEYVDWQDDLLASARGERLWSFWQAQLAGDLPVINLAVRQNRGTDSRVRSVSRFFYVNGDLTQKLKSVGRTRNATLYTALLAVYQLLLYRYTGLSRISVGSPTAGRSRAKWSGTVGYFVNPVVMKTDIFGAISFSEFLNQIRMSVLGALQHQDYPFPLLVEKLQPTRDESHSPLFQVMFVIYKSPIDADENLAQFALGQGGIKARIGTLLFESIALDPPAAKFDLTLAMAECGDGLSASFVYNPDLFDAGFIDRIVGHLLALIQGVEANPNCSINALPMLSERERDQLVNEWNSTTASYPVDICIHRLIERQAEKTPDDIAIVWREERLSYGELNNRSNRLAHYLCKLGAGPEVRVGISIGRSIDLIIGLLAILKSGSAYVPIDPSYPEQRIALMMQDSEMALLLTESPFQGRFRANDINVICAGADSPIFALESEMNLVTGVSADNLAYVIYTSGSTGRPKGVAIEHRSAVTFLHWVRDFFSEGELSGVLASTSICFDLSVFEVFAPLSWGGKVILAENALSLPDNPLQEEVRLINSVPSAMAELVRANALPKLACTVNLAGEALQKRLVHQIYQLETVKKVINLYGPSESTTYSTFAQANKDAVDDPPIGRPIANTEVYLLDSDLQIVPLGIASELYIGGAGLARGYLNHPALTAERFLPDPFSNRTPSRLYKTGDLARYLPDGDLEYLGRIDHQVKIRGFRIELGEIETLLTQHNAISAAAVLVDEDVGGNKRLIAYVVPENPELFDVDECRNYVQGRLPGYMVPSIFIPLVSMPLTPNGKHDRSALPSPPRGFYARAHGYVAPWTDDEARLQLIWKEVMGIEQVGIYDNFFELGGHSILATRLISEVCESFNIEISLHRFLTSPTIAGLAEIIGQLKSNGQALSDRRIVRVSRKAYRMPPPT